MLEQQNQSGRLVKFVAAIVCAALLGGLITYWSIDTYEAQNVTLQQQIADLQTQIEALKNPPAPPPEAILSALPAGTEIKFNSCDNIGTYASKDWFEKFKQAAADANFDFAKITNTCFSENGKIVIALIPQPKPTLGSNTCENGNILRYDITNNIVQAATVIDKAITCLGWPTQFGKREGTIIKMEGIVLNSESVKPKMYYDYDFVKNIFELKKEWATAPGMPEEGQWTNY